MQKVTLLTHTENPEQIIAAAAKLCYSSKTDIESLLNDLTPEKVEAFVSKLESLGHESPFEHVSFTFGVEGVSRALLAQATRSRIGVSFSVRSQRYVGESKFGYVVPPKVQANDERMRAYEEAMEQARQSYNHLIELGVPKEDARMVLPNACETRMVVTMNVRALWHFALLRCCNRAQWEIRSMAREMLKLAKEAAPALFKHAGAACEVHGYCPEGNMCCGKAPTLDKIMKVYEKHNGETREKV